MFYATGREHSKNNSFYKNCIAFIQYSDLVHKLQNSYETDDFLAMYEKLVLH